MKAKRKPLDEKSAADLGIDITPRHTVVTTEEPATRQAGVMVGSVDDLIAKLKEGGLV
jgi:electron transfer flavoprotein beta subunit